MIEIDNIYNMDCIEGMKLMANGSVDAVIADLPYGVLNRSNKAVHWDRQIPLEALWEQYRGSPSREAPLSSLRRAFSRRNSCSRNPGCGGITSCGGKTG